MAQTRFAEHTAEVVAEFDSQVRRLLADHPKANVVLLRGFDSQRDLPSMHFRFGINAAAAAIYPMYRGVGQLVGMHVLPSVDTLAGEVDLLRRFWDDHDYFFFHHKPSDSAGEDGNFEAKVAAIEALDGAIPDIVALGPDVIAVTGDHATPSQMAAHSWHPVPVAHVGAAGRPGRRHPLRRALGPAGRPRPPAVAGADAADAGGGRTPGQVRGRA